MPRQLHSSLHDYKQHTPLRQKVGCFKVPAIHRSVVKLVVSRQFAFLFGGGGAHSR